MAAVAECEMCCSTANDTDEGQLYNCTFPNCRMATRRLCLKCGIYSHRRHNIFNHEFCGQQRSRAQVQSRYKLAMLAKESETSIPKSGALQLTVKGSQAVAVIYQAGQIALKEAIKKGQKYTAKQIMKAGMKEVGKNGAKAAKLGLTKGVAVLQVIVCAWEIGVEYNRYSKGLISKKELERLTIRAVTANSASLGGAAGGAAFGFWCGGPPGAVIGGIIGGIAADMASRFVFDRWIWSNDKQKEYESDIKNALMLFRYIDVGINGVWKEDTFKRDTIVSRYHDLSLECHPDRPQGTVNKFETLLNYYNILLGIVSEKEKRN